MMQFALLIATLSSAPAVHATYVQQCILYGTIVSAPRVVRLYLLDGTETENSSFEMIVHHAAPNGRDDSGCNPTFKGKTIWVSLYAGSTDVKTLKKGDLIRLEYQHFDKGVGGAVDHFEFVPVP